MAGPNPFPSTPTTRMGGTAGRTSPIGRWHNSGRHYGDKTIGKWDIFHYVYGLLHHPTYRERYQANLKRDLPHLPYTPDFWAFAKAGQRLGEIHVGYEDVEEYPLRFVETPDMPLDWCVEKMKLSKRQDGGKIQRFLDA